MTPNERRLRALEARLNVGKLQRVPGIVVEPGETVDEVLARDGVAPVEGQRRGWPTLVVRQIVDPQKNVNAISDIDEPTPKE